MNQKKFAPLGASGNIRVSKSQIPLVIIITILLGNGSFQVFKLWLLMASVFTIILFQCAVELDDPKWLKAIIIISGIIIMIMCIGLAFFTQTQFRSHV